MHYNIDAPDAGHRVSSGYADDVAILTNNPRDTKVQAGKVTAYAQWSRLRAKKCAATAILHADARARLCKGPTDFPTHTSQFMNLTIDGDQIPVYRWDQP